MHVKIQAESRSCQVLQANVDPKEWLLEATLSRYRICGCGLGFRIRIQGSGSRVQGVGCWASGFGFGMILDTLPLKNFGSVVC